ncbi:patatin-like phospholipase family protein [Micromonospora sp. LAH09]|uniref:patatin-like phospholipase family protein n=1 Tax=Micromonospora cabrerizensis TaxID=2911213 RepID=UPI001EE8A7AE|nr:patatin-like phospholipase family protein [Micromonospora cabrerizensis]MCG5469767.1 patatin-like phospholipase family protein [Micromonospora cabrerizensis]
MTDDARPVWVLGGGGVTGIAWEVGVLAGLADEGVTVAPEAVLIGTSSGAVVGAQITSGMSLGELYDRQRQGVAHETSNALGFLDLLRLARAQLFARSPEQAARRLGRLALATPIPDPSQHRRTAEARLPGHTWKDADLRIVVVDAESGDRRAFTRHDGVSLVDAVAASCAMPLSTAPVTIDGHRYMDGGMRSTLNLDLAPGIGPVVALAPSTAAIGPWARIAKQRATLGQSRRVEVLLRDPASRRAQGTNVMDNCVVPALVAAAREQGRREASRVAAALGTISHS